MYKYLGNMPDFDRRFIEAERPMGKLETEEQYLTAPRFFKTFLVLKEYQEDLLCIQLGLCRYNSKVKFTKSEYSELKYDSSPTNCLVFINKDCVREVYDSIIKEDVYFKIMCIFTSSSFALMNEEQLKRAKDTLGEYYSSKIRRGSVINFNDERKLSYYVKNILLDGNLELIPLSYDRENGLCIHSLDTILLPYNFLLLYSYFYSEDYSNKIQSMINEKKLLLKG